MATWPRHVLGGPGAGIAARRRTRRGIATAQREEQAPLAILTARDSI